MEVICSSSFQQRVLALGGYDTTHTGRVMARFGPSAA